MGQEIKICGLRSHEALDAALAGADLVGFVRYAKSPRHVTLEEGRALSARARGKVLRTLLAVDPSDEELDAAAEALDPDLIQLHGGESPERVAAIRSRYGRPVMKALGIAAAADLSGIDRYAPIAERILLDAKPPREAASLPGGNGLAFDWQLIAGLTRPGSFMLSGGLSPENVGEAIAVTGLLAVDVSSGVERSPGDKDPGRIEDFIRAARAAWAAGRKDKVA
jgi:phosphoribosylanthranilate isomerase